MRQLIALVGVVTVMILVVNKGGDDCMVMNKIDPVISMLEALGICLDVGAVDGTII